MKKLIGAAYLCLATAAFGEQPIPVPLDPIQDKLIKLREPNRFFDLTAKPRIYKQPISDGGFLIWEERIGGAGAAGWKLIGMIPPPKAKPGIKS